MIKDLTVEQLLEGKAIQRGNVTFPRASEIVLPFISKLQPYTREWKVKVSQPMVQTVEEEHHGDFTEVAVDNGFHRVLLQAVLNDEYQLVSNPEDSYSKVIGMVYALDVVKPIIKVYSGGLRDACINLSIFSRNAVQYRHFADEDFSHIYDTIPGYLEAIDTERVEFASKIQYLTGDMLEGQQLYTELGKLAVKCVGKTNSMTTHFNAAIKLLFNNSDYGGIKNLYYQRDGRHTRYNIWNALTANITEKADFMQAPDLVQKAFSYFEN